FTLEGLEPAAAGTAKLEVTFTIDVNGMVLVGARDVVTGREQRVTVSIGTAAGRGQPTSRVPSGTTAAAAARNPVGRPDLPPSTVEALGDAEHLLAQAGEKMTRVDRASLTKIADHVRHAADRDHSQEELHRSAGALARVV